MRSRSSRGQHCSRSRMTDDLILTPCTMQRDRHSSLGWIAWIELRIPHCFMTCRSRSENLHIFVHSVHCVHIIVFSHWHIGSRMGLEILCIIRNSKGFHLWNRIIRRILIIHNAHRRLHALHHMILVSCLQWSGVIRP